MKIKCTNCGMEIDNDVGYCKKCGTVLNVSVIRIGKIISVVFILIAFMMILNYWQTNSNPQMQVNSNPQMQVITSEQITCVLVNIPIIEPRPYTVTKDVSIKLMYDAQGSQKNNHNILKGFDVWAQIATKVRNTDSVSGTFTVIQTIKTLNKVYPKQSSTKVLMPGETSLFFAEFDIDSGEDWVIESVDIIPSTKTVPTPITEWIDEIVGYRPEQQCKGG